MKTAQQMLTHHKEHLSLVLVRQQEETEDGGVGDFVVESLTVQVKKRWVDTNVISGGRRQKDDRIM